MKRLQRTFNPCHFLATTSSLSSAAISELSRSLNEILDIPAEDYFNALSKAFNGEQYQLENPGEASIIRLIDAAIAKLVRLDLHYIIGITDICFSARLLSYTRPCNSIDILFHQSLCRSMKRWRAVSWLVAH